MMMKYVLIMENPVQLAYFQFLKHIDIFSRSCDTGVMLLLLSIEYYWVLFTSSLSQGFICIMCFIAFILYAFTFTFILYALYYS